MKGIAGRILQAFPGLIPERTPGEIVNRFFGGVLQEMSGTFPGKAERIPKGTPRYVLMKRLEEFYMGLLKEILEELPIELLEKFLKKILDESLKEFPMKLSSVF